MFRVRYLSNTVNVMSTRSSLKKHTTLTAKGDKKEKDSVPSNNDETVASAATSVSGARDANSEGKVDGNTLRRPSSSWSLWNTANGSSEQAQASWWRRPSLISIGLKNNTVNITANCNGHDASTINGDQKCEQTQEPGTPLENTEQVSNSNSSSKTPWLFWNKKDEAKEVMRTKTPNLISNELISGESYDAILFKTKSDEQTTKESNNLGPSAQKKNLLVPGFDLLPTATIMTSIYSQITKLGILWDPHKAKPTSKPQSLYRRNAQIALNKLSEGKTRPVKVLIVGVHGFFPTKMIRPIIGEPTGTSVKFISEAENAVLRWFQRHDTHVEISKIALEKEGKVLDRVDFFFDVLKKWINEINKADFVYFVSHSQGCPVTIILLAKLIEAGIIDVDNIIASDMPPIAMKPNEKKKIISVLAMAGINNGPFYGADQTFFVKAYSAIEKDSLKELFQFQNFHSVLSQKFIQGLRICIASNVKISFVGSINDQLVPLYSSTCQFAHHPNIFKATFVDKDSKTPSFITRIVSIANHLSNLGYDDHGIIKEISGSLAGTLTGGGHSKIYNEEQVYELGIQFALETTDLPVDIPVVYKGYEVDQLGSNPYHLPWCMRGLLYETGVHLGREEIDALFTEFDQWEPETKQLKNVKYRLNGLKSKL